MTALRCAQCGSPGGLLHRKRPWSHASHGSKTWEVSNCFRKVWRSFVSLIVQPVCIVTPWCKRCSHCKKDTPTRDIIVGGHEDASASAPNAPQPPNSLEPVPPGDPLDDGPLPNCPIRYVLSRNPIDNALPVYAEPRPSSLVVLRPGQKALREPHQWSPGPFSTVIDVACCLRKSPTAVTGHQQGRKVVAYTDCPPIYPMASLGLEWLDEDSLVQMWPEGLRQKRRIEKKNDCSSGRQATFTSLSEESWDSNTLGPFVEEKGPRSHKMTTTEDEDLVPSQPEDPSAKP